MATRYLPQIAEYALRAMVCLATRTPNAAASREISIATGIPPKYLQKVLGQLARAGLLSAQRGAGGGYALTRRPDSITLHEIFEGVSAGVERISTCPLGNPGHTQLCPLHRRLDDAFSLIEAVFKTTTLSSICPGTAPALCEPRRELLRPEPPVRTQAIGP